MEFELKSLDDQHYIYVERTVSMDGAEIANAMASGFGELFTFVGAQDVKPLNMPMSLYMAMPANGEMTFRAGVFVSPDDAAKADGDVKADIIPAGKAMTTTHVGPYANLNQSHGALWNHVQEQGLEGAMPVWEIYVDDPQQIPEADVRTLLFRAVK